MISIFIAAAVAAEAPALPAFMTGCWETRSGTQDAENWTQECWMEPKSGLMLGASREGKGETLNSWEQLRIEQGPGGKLILYASPNGRAALPFEADKVSATAIEFVNASHDYPQRIRYELKGERLHARISLLDGSKAVEWSYDRQNR